MEFADYKKVLDSNQSQIWTIYGIRRQSGFDKFLRQNENDWFYQLRAFRPLTNNLRNWAK